MLQSYNHTGAGASSSGKLDTSSERSNAWIECVTRIFGTKENHLKEENFNFFLEIYYFLSELLGSLQHLLFLVKFGKFLVCD